MSKSKSSTSALREPARQIVVGLHDPIRIVPLHLASAIAAPAAVQLTYRDGPLLPAVEVFTIFWGRAWTQAPQAAMVGQVNQFFDVILTGALIDQLTEYSVPQYPIKHSAHSGTITITTPALHTSVTDTAIQQMLREQVAAKKGVPTPDSEHVVLRLSAAGRARRDGRLSVLSSVLRLPQRP